MLTHRTRLASLLLLLSAAPLVAQNVAWEAAVVRESDALRLVEPSVVQLGATNAVDGTSTVTLTLRCRAPVDCTRVRALRTMSGRTDTLAVAVVDARTATLSFAGREIPATAVAGSGATPALPTSLRIRVGTDTVAPPIFVSRFANGGPHNGATEPVAVGTLATVQCDAGKTVEAPMYSREGNRAQFLVTPTGNVLSGPTERMDEDDTVKVYVRAHPSLGPTLRVRRKSAFREVGGISIVGAGLEIPTAVFERHAAGAPVECDLFPVTLADFAPGRGEVEIAAVTPEGPEVLGTFEFGVNHLYTGSFSLGPVRSWVEDRTFGLVARGSDSVIAVVEDESPRTHYVLAYTPFIWGRRDIEKPTRGWHERVNPMVAVVLNDIPDNAMVGLSIDFFNASMYLVGGVHARRVTELNSASGMREGSVFTGTSEQIPTERDTALGGFLGVMIDLRAAVQLLSTALTAATGS